MNLTLIGLGLLGWTVVSIIYVLMNLGNKYGTDAWYDWVLGAPVLLLIIILCAPRDLRIWFRRRWPYQEPRQAIGRVELGGIGSDGRSITVHDSSLGPKPMRFAASFDPQDIDWEEGIVVTYEVYWDNRVPHARNIKKAVA